MACLTPCTRLMGTALAPSRPRYSCCTSMSVQQAPDVHRRNAGLGSIIWTRTRAVHRPLVHHLQKHSEGDDVKLLDMPAGCLPDTASSISATAAYSTDADALPAAARVKVGFVGFGQFGRFLAERMVAAGHTVIATSRRDHQQDAQQLGVSFYSDVHDFCEQHPEVLILSCSILSLEEVLHSIPWVRLRRSTLVVDVLSVKSHSKQLLLHHLPPEMDILCTHPMFGPVSGSGSWEGLKFMYEKVRIAGTAEEHVQRAQWLQSFLDFFCTRGCCMVQMSCEEHDDLAAASQFLTHTVGRVLHQMEVQSTSINTAGYESLLRLAETTANDSMDLYCGLFLCNPCAMQQLERMEQAFLAVKTQLLRGLQQKMNGNRQTFE